MKTDRMDVRRDEMVIPYWAFFLACLMFALVGLALGAVGR